MNPRRLMLRYGAALAGAATGLTGLAATETPGADYPRQPVRMIVPFPPGGPTDTMARLVATRLQEAWGQSVIVDYKPGAGTIIGMDHIAKSAPDGYTFGIANSSLAVNPYLHKTLPYDTLRDLAAVTQLVRLQQAIVARVDAPFNNLAEMIAWAKKNPGKLAYGTPGAGSTTHLGGELLKREAGFDMLHAPFKGSAPAHTELMGGRIDVVIDPFLSVIPYVQAGRMKMIATLGDRRVPGYDFPTAAETLPGFSVIGMLGFVAPAATPRAVVRKMQADTARVLAVPETRQRIEGLGMQVVGSSPAEFDALLRSEMKRWSKVIAEAKISLD